MLADGWYRLALTTHTHTHTHTHSALPTQLTCRCACINVWHSAGVNPALTASVHNNSHDAAESDPSEIDSTYRTLIGIPGERPGT
jgi:hypothetical protein